MKHTIILILCLVAICSLTITSCGLHHIGQSPATVWHNSTSAYGIPSAKEPTSKDMAVVRTAFMATTQYLFTHGYHYPVATTWEENIRPYWNNQVPFSMALTDGHRLAMNNALSGAKHSRADITDDTILFYEAEITSKDANGIPPPVSLHQNSGTAPVAITVGGYSVNE